MSDRKNYHTIRYGNVDGEIKFGHLHYDDELSSVLLSVVVEIRNTMSCMDSRW